MVIRLSDPPNLLTLSRCFDYGATPAEGLQAWV